MSVDLQAVGRWVGGCFNSSTRRWQLSLVAATNERERETLFAVTDAVRLVKNVMASLCVDRFERQNETIKHATPRWHRATIKCCAPNRGASGRGDLTAPSTSFDFVCVCVCVCVGCTFGHGHGCQVNSPRYFDYCYVFTGTSCRERETGENEGEEWGGVSSTVSGPWGHHRKHNQ